MPAATICLAQLWQGYVVEYNKDQLRDAIFNLLINEKLQKRFAVEGKKLVKDKFSWNNVVKKVETLYETMLTKWEEKQLLVEWKMISELDLN